MRAEVHRVLRRGVEVQEGEVIHLVETDLLVLQKGLVLVQKHHAPQEGVDVLMDRRFVAAEETLIVKKRRMWKGSPATRGML